MVRSSKMADDTGETMELRDPGEIKETLRDLRILGKYASCFERFFRLSSLSKNSPLESHLDKFEHNVALTLRTFP